ncbi:OsmC family protein [Roseobacter sp. YSTF-M11]|uniref:OsmC family protein n=1 Tax=Roseobacter insulae TaxID=2859783 RepID=A0A9X1FRD5_9RHOB|nr:OsmC family protein [Roseobacter insulae]MBW4706374.1 OsmC family protein [Roseobacter insulae]
MTHSVGTTYDMTEKASDTPMFEVIFDVQAKAVGKMRAEMRIEAFEPFKSVNHLAIDEGTFQGGEGTAPTPLEFFLTGFAGCLMVQIKAFAKKKRIQIDALDVQLKAKWEAHKGVHVPYIGAPVGFELFIDIDSPSSEAEIQELVKSAQLGCFVEQTMAQINSIGHTVRKSGGDWVELT